MVSGLALNVPPHAICGTALGVKCGHDVGASSKGADRKATADQLAERGEIGGDAVGETKAAEGETERDDLVDNHERAVAGSELANGVDELGVSGWRPARFGMRSMRTAAIFGPARIEELPKRRRVALREDDDGLALGIRDAGLVEVGYRVY
jgi:hypothetical protein